MDRETAVKLWREIGLGMPGGGATKRLIEDFAVAVEAAERERCAKVCEDSNTFDEYDPGGHFAELIRGPGA